MEPVENVIILSVETNQSDNFNATVIVAKSENATTTEKMNQVITECTLSYKMHGIQTFVFPVSAIDRLIETLNRIKIVSSRI